MSLKTTKYISIPAGVVDLTFTFTDDIPTVVEQDVVSVCNVVYSNIATKYVTPFYININTPDARTLLIRRSVKEDGTITGFHTNMPCTILVKK